jgi:hypothetical protein
MATATIAPVTSKDIARARMFGIRLPKPVAKPVPPVVPKPATGRCSLRLRINGTSYKVRPLPADFASHRAFRLTKANGEFHDVSRGVCGAECTCGDLEAIR